VATLAGRTTCWISSTGILTRFFGAEKIQAQRLIAVVAQATGPDIGLMNRNRALIGKYCLSAG